MKNKEKIPTIDDCLKEMTSKETSKIAIKNIIKYHIDKALTEAANKAKTKKGFRTWE